MEANGKRDMNASGRDSRLKTLLRNTSITALIASSLVAAQDNTIVQNTKTNLPFEGVGYSPFRVNEAPAFFSGTFPYDYPTVGEIASDLTNAHSVPNPDNQDIWDG